MLSIWRRLRGYLIVLLIGGLLTYVSHDFFANTEREVILAKQSEQLREIEYTVSRELLQTIYISEWLAQEVTRSPTPILQRLRGTDVLIRRYFPSIDSVFFVETGARQDPRLYQVTDDVIISSPNDPIHDAIFKAVTQTRMALAAPSDARIIASDFEQLFIAVRIERTLESGILLLRFNLRDFMRDVMNIVLEEGYQFQLWNQTEVIFNFSGDLSTRNDWTVYSRLRIDDTSFRSELWPTQERLNASLSSTPQLTVAIGSALTLLGMFIFALARLLQRRGQMLRDALAKANEKLQRQHNLDQQVRFLREHDELTELPNRQALMNYLRGEINAIEQRKGQLLAAHMNLDAFRKLNEALGHSMGDEVLRRIAHRLRKFCPPRGFVARLSGDEFVLILPDIYTDEQALEAAHQIQALVAPQFYIEKHEVYCSCAIGLAFANDADYQPTRLLQQAEMALNEARRQGYNGVSIYTRRQQDELVQRRLLLSQLYHAIEHEQVEVHYQPVFDLKTQKICRIEALIRWRQHASRLLQPDEFLPIIEDTGLIVPVTQRCIRQVADDISALREAGHRDLVVHLNFSAKQLGMTSLANELSELLTRTQLPPQQLAIELRDYVFINGVQQQPQHISALLHLGIQIFIDTVGIHHETTHALKHVAPHGMKINRSLISQIPVDTVNSKITNTILELADQQDLQVIAVGVENQQQIDYLLQRNCFLAQGHFLCRPLSHAQLLSLLASDKQAFVVGEDYAE